MTLDYSLHAVSTHFLRVRAEKFGTPNQPTPKNRLLRIAMTPNYDLCNRLPDPSAPERPLAEPSSFSGLATPPAEQPPNKAAHMQTTNNTRIYRVTSSRAPGTMLSTLVSSTDTRASKSRAPGNLRRNATNFRPHP